MPKIPAPSRPPIRPAIIGLREKKPAAACGAPELVLVVYADNTPALRLYRKLGFVPTIVPALEPLLTAEAAAMPVLLCGVTRRVRKGDDDVYALDLLAINDQGAVALSLAFGEELCAPGAQEAPSLFERLAPLHADMNLLMRRFI
jgi:hypothetical protein